MVDLLLQVLRMGQLGSQVTIVRQQEHTSGVAVQTTNGVDALRTSVLHQIHHGLTLLRIVTGRHVVLRLVEQHIDLLLDGHGLIVELHLVGTQDLGTQLCYHLTIHGDDTSLDKLISLTTAADTCIGQEFVQAQRLIGIIVDLLVLNALLQAVLSIRIVVGRMLTGSFLIGG